MATSTNKTVELSQEEIDFLAPVIAAKIAHTVATLEDYHKLDWPRSDSINTRIASLKRQEVILKELFVKLT